MEITRKKHAHVCEISSMLQTFQFIYFTKFDVITLLPRLGAVQTQRSFNVNLMFTRTVIIKAYL